MVDDNDIYCLYDESIAAGDYEMAALCVLAVFGPATFDIWCQERGVELLFAWTVEEAQEECAKVIAENQTNHKE